MILQIEETPNPNALKFVFGNLGYSFEPVSFNLDDSNINSALVRVLFKIEGIVSVMLTTNAVVVRKNDGKLWDSLRQMIFESIESFFQVGLALFDGNEEILPSDNTGNCDIDDNLNSDIVKQIKALLDDRVKPALAMDGGSVVFRGFDNGIVLLELKGACIGCPSANITLKHGIENLLKYYIPEVIEVKSV
ncbi:NFU1 iron-sulfur cluster scaffold homolog, mitochondrial [Candidatus Xenohaliotis californiensis]|uniref:NFU1 iron-sulfur cluster scaffold homolog, mitochondrial n=1 Tax=Candidatus Xenohaliotis californiensis TaxID=84677 RepID=A0ABM9N7Y6_9RICK|nr:NFU1 iron-sulfur cluster scaffold homolog, mitochondrial [Candidatus Xenohaliotis californiensis]